MNNLTTTSKTEVGFTAEQVQVLAGGGQFEVDPIRGCWLWLGCKAGRGYGVTSFFKRHVYVHRLSYRLFRGETPSHLVVMHTCDTPACFNPAHLALGTQRDNVQDMDRKKRRKSADMAGPKNPRCKFTDEVIALIRADFAAGMPARELRTKYKIGQAHLWRVTRNRSRK